MGLLSCVLVSFSNLLVSKNFAVFSSINPDSTSPNIGSVENLVIPIVNLIYNYYLGVPMTAANRVNLQYDISVQDFINLGTSGKIGSPEPVWMLSKTLKTFGVGNAGSSAVVDISSSGVVVVAAIL